MYPFPSTFILPPEFTFTSPVTFSIKLFTRVFEFALCVSTAPLFIVKLFIAYIPSVVTVPLVTVSLPSDIVAPDIILLILTVPDRFVVLAVIEVFAVGTKYVVPLKVKVSNIFVPVNVALLLFTVRFVVEDAPVNVAFNVVPVFAVKFLILIAPVMFAVHVVSVISLAVIVLFNVTVELVAVKSLIVKLPFMFIVELFVSVKSPNVELPVKLNIELFKLVFVVG